MRTATKYGWHRIGPGAMPTQRYVLPAMEALVPMIRHGGIRVLDIGCGNGALSKLLAERGCDVVGVEPTSDGITECLRESRGVQFVQDAADAGLIGRLDLEPFDVVLSVEVVEHVFDTRAWAAACYNALKPGGQLVCSTPYHGYLKNLAMALAGRWDRHHQVSRAGGHIKFFSPRTLEALLADTGFTDIEWRGAGRAPYFWMSMVMRARRPL